MRSAVEVFGSPIENSRELQYLLTGQPRSEIAEPVHRVYPVKALRLEPRVMPNSVGKYEFRIDSGGYPRGSAKIRFRRYLAIGAPAGEGQESTPISAVRRSCREGQLR